MDIRRARSARLYALAGGVALAVVLAVSTGLKLRDFNQWLHRPNAAAVTPRPAIVPAPRTVQNVHREDPKARLGTDSSVSTVPLRLQLVRTLPGRDIHSGQALLGVDRNHPQTYLAGAILENGARLQEIYRDHVVLVKGAHRTTLYVASAIASEDSGNTDALAMVGGPAPAVESPLLSVEPVTDYLRPVPVYQNGVITGFQVYPGARSAVFTKWGLQPGDVMTELEGQPVNDADSLMQTLRGLVEGETLTATVQRAGAPVSVTLDGTQIEPLRTASSGPSEASLNPTPAR
jgi:type II secretion system protein C